MWIVQRESAPSDWRQAAIGSDLQHMMFKWSGMSMRVSYANPTQVQPCVKCFRCCMNNHSITIQLHKTLTRHQSSSSSRHITNIPHHPHPAALCRMYPISRQNGPRWDRGCDPRTQILHNPYAQQWASEWQCKRGECIHNHISHTTGAIVFLCKS